MAALAGPQLDWAFLENWGERFSVAWNTHDPDAVAALCAEDIRWSDPALPGSPTSGRTAVHDFAAFTFAAFPDFRVEERDSVYVSWTEPMALCPYRMTGTASGSRDAGSAPGTATMEVDGIDRWTFRDDLLCRYDTYYDHAEMIRQLTGG
jgi:ketosteroid isomerase-like protein